MANSVYADQTVLLGTSLICFLIVCSDLSVPILGGAQIAQWVKCWPTDLAVPGLSST